MHGKQQVDDHELDHATSRTDPTDLSPPEPGGYGPGVQTSTTFEQSRRLITTGLVLAASLLVAYWVLWWADRGLIASRTTSSYYSFEDAFQVADAWLLVTVGTAALQLARRRASALLWLIAAGSAGLYLFGMDVFYDLAHRIYATSSGGVIELIIDILVASASVTLLVWSWQHRTDLLTQPRAPQDPRHG